MTAGWVVRERGGVVSVVPASEARWWECLRFPGFGLAFDRAKALAGWRRER